MTATGSHAADTVSLAGLTKSFDRASRAVDQVTLDLPAHGITALLGPSGCGKTTTLKLLAGLLEPDAGDVRIGGISVLGVPAERRPVGMVFQRPLLFPHLDVADNVAFGLRMRGTPRPERERRVAEMLDLVQLPGYGARRVHQLSGGQEQRVALARALVTSPRVLLLDEPFSALDANLRMEMRALLRHVQSQVAVTTLLVTHDQDEAVELAGRVALMLDGRVEQFAAPRDFYERPATVAAARFFGARNLVPGTVTGGRFRCALGDLLMRGDPPDGPGTLVVRPEAVRLTEGGGRNTVDGTVIAADYRGTHVSVTVDVGGLELVVHAGPSTEVPLGARVAVHLPQQDVTVVPGQEDGRAAR